ncbi:protein PhaF [Longibacter salinarum]|uniref:Protein PhaF n=1 Tax=Longibacter salinarum TaxID=1850348 RepID=A0A2A8CUT3_9BACT|nr:phasin family protein [Longibacter salinarum]PEN12263.1 protein PhaF [Longibacter salinarum]
MSTKAKNSNLQDELTRRGRDVWLAGLGALATVEEEGTKAFNSLVERGKGFEEKGRKQIEDAISKASKQRDEALSDVERAGEEAREYIFNTVDRALDRFGVATRSEVDKLTKQVSNLNDKVDKLTKTLRDGTKTKKKA